MSFKTEDGNIVIHRTKESIESYNRLMIKEYLKDHKDIVGIILKSWKHGKFKVTERSDKKDDHGILYNIEFLNTEFILFNVRKGSIISGCVKDHSNDLFVGKIIDTRFHGPIKIINYGMPSKKSNTWDIKFLNSGAVKKNVQTSHINDGNIDDFMDPALNGSYIGCDDDTLHHIKNNDYELYKKVKRLHESLFHKCYIKSDTSYQRYGATGVTVCDRWRSFYNFYTDIQILPGFNRDKIVNSALVIDKDEYYISRGIHDKSLYQYNPETCQWISPKDNHPVIMKNKYKVNKDN